MAYNEDEDSPTKVGGFFLNSKRGPESPAEILGMLAGIGLSILAAFGLIWIIVTVSVFVIQLGRDAHNGMVYAQTAMNRPMCPTVKPCPPTNPSNYLTTTPATVPTVPNTNTNPLPLKWNDTTTLKWNDNDVWIIPSPESDVRLEMRDPAK